MSDYATLEAHLRVIIAAQKDYEQDTDTRPEDDPLTDATHDARQALRIADWRK